VIVKCPECGSDIPIPRCIGDTKVTCRACGHTVDLIAGKSNRKNMYTIKEAAEFMVQELKNDHYNSVVMNFGEHVREELQNAIEVIEKHFIESKES
jgi:uncharacterized Zn finger protein (UPF0148 family)